MASDAKARFSSKVEYHAVIRYLYLKGKTGKEIHGGLADDYGSSAPTYAQIKFLVGEFKCGRTSLEDEARSTDEEMCKKVRDLVYSDRRIQIEETAQTLGISHGSVDFLLRLVTLDETWVHYYEPENKAQSRQWGGPGSPRPTKFKTQPSAGKVMVTLFSDAKGVIMLDFFPKRSTSVLCKLAKPAENHHP